MATKSFPQLSACNNKPIIEFCYLAQSLYSAETFKILLKFLKFSAKVEIFLRYLAIYMYQPFFSRFLCRFLVEVLQQLSVILCIETKEIYGY